ncbi:MAG: 6-carboxytetrahydropterin synthase [Pseudomonadota bacterium]
MHIFKEFHFDAAHQLGANVAAGHKYGRVHGHSFRAQLRFSGEPAPETGWICDFADIDTAIADIQAALDHQYLNEIPGLEQPTLERLCIWIWTQVEKTLPALSQVTVWRGTQKEGCIYTGPGQQPVDID